MWSINPKGWASGGDRLKKGHAFTKAFGNGGASDGFSFTNDNSIIMESARVIR